MCDVLEDQSTKARVGVIRFLWKGNKDMSVISAWYLISTSFSVKMLTSYSLSGNSPRPDSLNDDSLYWSFVTIKSP